MDKNKPNSITWEADEYIYRPKTRDWYWAVAILSAGVVVVSFITANFLLGVLALIAGFTIILYGSRPPQKVRFAINHEGVVIDKRLYNFEDLHSFWIHYDPPHKKELGIISKKPFMPKISIPLADQDPNKVREYLLDFLEEEEHEESLAEAISHFFGF